MRPVQIHGMKYDYSTKGIVEFTVKDNVPMSSSDKFGLGIRVTTEIVSNSSKAVTIRAKDCKVFLRTGDKPIRVGQCDVEFISGSRRECTLSPPPYNANTLYLNIFFLQHELLLLERFRQHSDLRLNLEVEFIFAEESADGHECHEKTGFGYVDDYKIPKLDWEDILRKTNFLMSESIAVSESVSNDPSWTRALHTLQNARNRLNSGDGVVALDEVNQVLKKFVKFPYNGTWTRPHSNQDSWAQYIETNFPQIEQPKVQAIAQLMGGLGGYLNKTSHHREDIITPTSQYEHELIVTTAQLLLTYLYRLGVTESGNLPNVSEE